jgi:preprotein translocase subunit SecY
MAGLNTLRQLLGLLPEVADRRATPVPFPNKALNTVTSVLVFLAGSRLPLYGLSTTAAPDPDPLYWIHAAGASNYGTIMAQGVYPLLASELVIHPLFGLKVVRLNIPMEERMQFM